MNDQKYFSPVDYVIFGITLLVSSIIGIYFAWKQRKKASSSEYLLASQKISWFPIFVSMVASFISAVGVMGIPAQIYRTGITFTFHITSFIFPIVLCAEIFTPIFRRLELISVNEYLEKRFSLGVRILGCIFFHVQYLIYLSVVLYAPSLALEAVAEVPLYVTIISTGVVCTFYTSLGGMKSVIWTDVFQSAVMIAGLIVTAILGAREVGSLKMVFDIASKGQRLTIDIDPDPRALHTVWGMAIGLTFSMLVQWTISQPTAQRAIAARSLRDAKLALYASFLGLAAIFGLLTLVAMIAYSVYADCDLLESGRIKQNDQVLPYFVVTKLGHLKGMPGLFTACLFSFALSTLSSGLNAMSALFLEDVVVKFKPGISDRMGTLVAKLAAVFGGIFVTGFAFAVPYLGKYVLKIAIQLFGIIGGPYFVMFALGIFTKKANKFGAFSAALTGFAVGVFLSIGQILYPHQYSLPPVSVARCTGFNSTRNSTIGELTIVTPHNSPFSKIFTISYCWVGFISIILAYVVGYIVSFCTSTCAESERIDKDLLYDYHQNYLIRLCWCKRKSEGNNEMVFSTNYGDSDRLIVVESFEM